MSTLQFVLPIKLQWVLVFVITAASLASSDLYGANNDGQFDKPVKDLIRLFPKPEQKGMRAYAKALSFSSNGFVKNESYQGYAVKKLMVEVVAVKKPGELSDFVCRALTKLATLDCHTVSNSFNDVTQLSSKELSASLREQGFDSYLLITAVDYDISSSGVNGFSFLTTRYILKGLNGEELSEGAIETKSLKSEYVYYDYLSLGSLMPLVIRLIETEFFPNEASSHAPLNMGAGLFLELNVRCRNFFKTRDFSEKCLKKESIAMSKLHDELKGGRSAVVQKCLAGTSPSHTYYRDSLTCAGIDAN